MYNIVAFSDLTNHNIQFMWKKDSTDFVIVPSRPLPGWLSLLVVVSLKKLALALCRAISLPRFQSPYNQKCMHESAWGCLTDLMAKKCSGQSRYGHYGSYATAFPSPFFFLRLASPSSSFLLLSSLPSSLSPLLWPLSKVAFHCIGYYSEVCVVLTHYQ